MYILKYYGFTNKEKTQAGLIEIDIDPNDYHDGDLNDLADQLFEEYNDLVNSTSVSLYDQNDNLLIILSE